MQQLTNVDRYWSEKTVKSEYFKSRQEADLHTSWRLNMYPFYKEFMALGEAHKDEIILDYGCGPGNDVIHFMKTGAKKIIGMDISDKALSLAKHYISLYPESKIPIEFIKIIDGATTIPLESESVDYIICSGVLHHVSNPTNILKEFFRILKKGSYTRIMVYNHNSIFFHVYVAYQLGGGFGVNNIDEVFKRSTDGVNCPISKAYLPDEFIEMCEGIGFKTEFIGGYFSSIDSVLYLNKYKQKLLNDPNIREEHKIFVNEIKIDNVGFPVYNGKYCGIGGVYKLQK